MTPIEKDAIWRRLHANALADLIEMGATGDEQRVWAEGADMFRPEPAPSRPLYNHAFDVAFQVRSYHDGSEADPVTADELIAGLRDRLRDFDKGREDIEECCGGPFDTYIEYPRKGEAE